MVPPYFEGAQSSSRLGLPLSFGPRLGETPYELGLSWGQNLAWEGTGKAKNP